MDLNVTFLIAVASIGIGFFLFYVAWNTHSSAKNISEWEMTQGTITKSGVKPAGSAFIPAIEYQYSVLGVEYKGVSVTIPPDIIQDSKVAQGLLDQYPVGKRVDVFYNPEIHGVAVLEQESPAPASWISWILGGTALAFLIFGFAILVEYF